MQRQPGNIWKRMSNGKDMAIHSKQRMMKSLSKRAQKGETNFCGQSRSDTRGNTCRLSSERIQSTKILSHTVDSTCKNGQKQFHEVHYSQESGIICYLINIFILMKPKYNEEILSKNLIREVTEYDTLYYCIAKK